MSLRNLILATVAAFAAFAAPARLFSQAGALELPFAPPLRSGSAVYSVAVQTNGQIVLGGLFITASEDNPSTNIARLNPDGSLDATFRPGGAADNGYVTAIAIQTDGKILVGGSFSSFAGTSQANLTRLLPDGSVDRGFDPALFVDAAINAVVVQSDGKILIGGAFFIVDFVLRRNIARLNPDGTLDGEFDACVASSSGSGATGLAVQKDGKILAAGRFSFSTGGTRNGIARLGSCGELDGTYATGVGVNSGATVFSLALREDGRLLLGGSFTAFDLQTRGGIVQLTTNGTVDASFDPGTGLEVFGIGYTLALQKDAKVVVAGFFAGYNGEARSCIARVNSDGSPDASFDPGLGTAAPIGSLALQPDGRILVAGKFDTFDGVTRNGLARLGGDPVPLHLEGPTRRPGGGWQLLLYGDSQACYRIDASSDLLEWTSITNVIAGAGPTPVVDSVAGSSSSRFYRASSCP